MSEEHAAEVQQAVNYFHELWVNRKAPADSELGRVRRLLNAADRLETPPSEETQLRLDELSGFLVWGRMMYSAAVLDPRLLGLERRRERATRAGLQPWEDIPC